MKENEEQEVSQEKEDPWVHQAPQGLGAWMDHLVQMDHLVNLVKRVHLDTRALLVWLDCLVREVCLAHQDSKEEEEILGCLVQKVLLVRWVKGDLKV